MEESRGGRTILIILCIAAIVVIGFGAVMNIITDGKHDWDKMREGENSAIPMTKEEKELKERLGNFQTVVLRNTTNTKNDSFSYELSSRNDKLYFSCAFYDDGEYFVIKNREVSNDRMTQVAEIIDRYTIATTIRKYRQDPESVQIESNDSQALEITWFEGTYLNLGYPNGAGPALEKYFKELAQWLGVDQIVEEKPVEDEVYVIGVTPGIIRDEDTEEESITNEQTVEDGEAIEASEDEDSQMQIIEEQSVEDLAIEESVGEE